MKVSVKAFDLRVTRWGHRARREAIPAGAGDLTLGYKLEPAAARTKPKPRGIGTLRVAAAIGGKPVRALVFLDGKRKGETPLLIKVPTGRHKLEAWRGKSSRKARTVYVQANKTRTIIFKLKKK